MSSYIGKEPTYGVFIMQSATGDGSTTAITLNATAADATQLMVSVGGLLQKPRTAYTLNTAGTTLTFSEAPASGIEIFIVFLGKQITGPRIMADSITSQAAITSLASDDAFLIYDTSVGDLRKVNYQYVHTAVADMAANTVKVRNAATTGAPEDFEVTNEKILIGDGTGFTAAALSGDVTMANTGAVTIASTAVEEGMIADNAITLAKMAGLARGKIIYGDSSGDPAALTVGSANQALVSDGTDIAWGSAGAQLGTANEWTAQQNFNNTALTFDATQDWALAANQVATLTLTANTTFDAPTQMVDGAFYSLIIIQDGTGSRTASWNGVFKWAAATAPTLTTTASAKDIFVWRSDGTNMYEVGRQLNVS